MACKRSAVRFHLAPPSKPLFLFEKHSPCVLGPSVRPAACGPIGDHPAAGLLPLSLDLQSIYILMRSFPGS